MHSILVPGGGEEEGGKSGHKKSEKIKEEGSEKGERRGEEKKNDKRKGEWRVKRRGTGRGKMGKIEKERKKGILSRFFYLRKYVLVEVNFTYYVILYVNKEHKS